MKPQMQRIKNEKLTIQQEKNLIADYQSNSTTAEYSLVRLVNHYKNMVSEVTKSYMNQKPNRENSEDIMADGKLGLLDGINKYDLMSEIKPSTYLTSRIRGQILDGLRDRMNGHEGRKKELGKIRRASSAFKFKHHRDPTAEELSEITGISKNNLVSCNLGEKTTTSIDELNMLDKLEGQNSASVTNNIEQGQVKEYVQTLFNSAYEEGDLKEKQASFFSLTYLIDQPMPPIQVGKIFDISNSAVVQSNTLVFKKLRKRATKLDGFTLDDFI